ncbi:aminotransferase class IV [Schnuerera sp.]|uniref:aminotransferase class IV n=1 Tax=Schnuerera sp. TaxID=2794844 RepID=UPI002BB250BC|nr:aminotransferase class IV [Schnuerera sp.]HSH35583.1 aminotransferase class IV [Schnuerera sp.]
MKPEAIKDYFLVNGKVESITNVEIFEKITKPPIYEVIRVIDKVPLFLEEHLNRMRESAKIVDYHIIRKDKEIEKDIKELINKNSIENLNVKLLCADIEGMGQVFLAYFIKSFYPPEEYYKKGIHTILFHYERKNPNAKVQMVSFREEVAKKLEENNAFEALLVNKNGYIPEGSRSNMFFVKGDKIYTAPKGDVLLGITRKYIFQVCEELNIKIIEENIHIEDLEKLDGAFMSGTSVNVLPISSVDDIKLNSINNKIIKEANNAYINKMKTYIKKKTL